MTETEHVVLPLPPLGNHRNGLNLHSGRFYPTDETKKYRRLVQLTCVGMTPLRGPVGARVQIRRARGARGDIDGYLKCLLDHLQGAAWANDSQVYYLEVEIFDVDEKTQRVDVWFWERAVSLGKSEAPPLPKVKRERASLKPNTYRNKSEAGNGNK